MKFEQRVLAQKLRGEGGSYGEILKKIKVSKSTLSLWLRDIKLTEKQKYRLYVTARQQNAYRLAKQNQNKKISIAKKIISQSIQESTNLLKNKLFLSGIMLYWAEGDKSEATELVKFSNSDPIMITLIMRWFREVCNVPEKKFRVGLHIHELLHKEHLKAYWSKITGIPAYQFHKIQIKKSSLKHRRNMLYNGTCSIRVSDKNLFRKIKGWKIGVQKKLKSL